MGCRRRCAIFFSLILSRGRFSCSAEKGGDRLKALVWDGSGLCVYAKRLERGKFVWPRAHEGALRLSAAQMAMLIEGLNWKQAIVHDEVITPRLA